MVLWKFRRFLWVYEYWRNSIIVYNIIITMALILPWGKLEISVKQTIAHEFEKTHLICLIFRGLFSRISFFKAFISWILARFSSLLVHSSSSQLKITIIAASPYLLQPISSFLFQKKQMIDIKFDMLRESSYASLELSSTVILVQVNQ